MARLITRAGYDRLYARRQKLDRQYRELSGRDKSASRSGGGGNVSKASSDGCEHETDVIGVQIAEIDLILNGAKIVAPAVDFEKGIGIGHVITIEIDDGVCLRTKTYQIDGYAETVPEPGPQIVGYYAPLIAQLIGLREGATYSAELDNWYVEVTILKIELPSG